MLDSSHRNNVETAGNANCCASCTQLQTRLARAEEKLELTQEALKAAKKTAREGLMDMAEQNAKLVAAYVEKKREVKQLQVMSSSGRLRVADAAANSLQCLVLHRS